MIYDEVLERCTHIDITKMEHSEWLDKRRSFIGGSDAGAIMELSNYGSKLTVFLEKKGKAKIEENDAMLRGSIMEPYIRQLTQKKFPSLQIEVAPYIFKSKAHPFMGANVDGYILIDEKTMGNDSELVSLLKDRKVQGLGVHEIKTSQDGYGFGPDEIPDSYYAQVHHYFSVSGTTWAILTVYIIGKNELRHYLILRNEEFIDKMIPIEKDFYENNLLKDNMPAGIGIDLEEDMITGMFAGSEPIILDNTQRDLCGEYVVNKRQIKELEEKNQAIKVNLMQGIVEKAKGSPAERKVSALAGPFSVSWTTVERRDVDRDKLKKAGLFEDYQKVTTYDRFTVTEKKGA
ncbi:MAG: YqaJ viral recombinase family protein [Treponema sp.]|jgi:putative phage-type endonuclease|nr:YqaJ viral recombinase family protein [Treponema sp.]